MIPNTVDLIYQYEDGSSTRVKNVQWYVLNQDPIRITGQEVLRITKSMTMLEKKMYNDPSCVYVDLSCVRADLRLEYYFRKEDDRYVLYVREEKFPKWRYYVEISSGLFNDLKKRKEQMRAEQIDAIEIPDAVLFDGGR